MAKHLIKTTIQALEWQITSNSVCSHCFYLKDMKTKKILCKLVLPKASDRTFLHLIACAPELQDIAEMYRDYMLGKHLQQSMVFAVVSEVLDRLTSSRGINTKK